MADTKEAARKRRAYIRKTWLEAQRPFRALWHWASNRQRLLRFRSLQGWAKRRQRAATTDRGRRKWKKKFYEYKAKADALENPTPTTGCGDPGSPAWAGGMSICEREVVPVFSARGVPISSRKRTVTLGNPSSDHYVGNTTAYAVDAATYNGRDHAHAVANALGISGYSTGNYNPYTIRRCDRTFRVQILWAVSGHYDHVHVGVRRS